MGYPVINFYIDRQFMGIHCSIQSIKKSRWALIETIYQVKTQWLGIPGLHCFKKCNALSRKYYNSFSAWFNGLRRRLWAQKSWVQTPHSSTRRAENRINFFTDSIRNQHSKLRVMNFARNFQVPKLRVWQKLPKLIPKLWLSGNRRILRSFGRKWITVYHFDQLFVFLLLGFGLG
jgi:hypothetical protein